MRLKVLLPSMLSLFVLASCGPNKLTISNLDGSKSVSLIVDVMDTPAKRDHGLMNRLKLDADKGMFFAFPEPSMLSFWMKNTNIPLEVMFFDATGAFVSASQMTPCKVDPCQKYNAQAASQYALEVNPDFRKANEIGVGWTLDLKQVKKMARPK